MQKDNENQPGGGNLLYQTEDGKTRLEVQFQGETVWLSQAPMSELFQTTKQNVNLHIQNIYDEHELEHTGTVKESLTVRPEGVRQLSRDGERSEAATCKLYLQVRNKADSAKSINYSATS